MSLSEQNRALDLETLARDLRGPQAAMCLHQAGFHDLGEFVDLLLDAARTEGRGEGEQVAWAYEYTNHLKGDRAPGGWLRAVAFEAPSRARVNAGFARNVQPLYASPSPDLVGLGEPCTLVACPPGLFLSEAHGTLGMKTEYHTAEGAIEAYIVESGEFFWGDYPQTIPHQREQIVRPIPHDAILSRLSNRGLEGLEGRPSQPCAERGPNPVLTETPLSDGES